jgi:hypothetical protein
MSTPEDLGPAKTFFAYMEAVMASDLTPTQRLVLLVQAKHADAHEGTLTNSFPSEETLAVETGLNRKTIQRTRKSLVEDGWLDQTHCGRGGSSKLANSYDLYIPDELIARLEDAESKRHSVSLQSDIESRQSDIESQSKRHSVSTSIPSSTHSSAPAPAPSTTGGVEESKEGTEEGRGDSYWVGYSKKHPDGYFFRAKGKSRPKGNVVLVTLTGREVMNVFGVGYEYEQLRKTMLDYARDAGLRPSPGPSSQSGVLSRAERDKLYGLAPSNVTSHRPERKVRSQQEIARDILEGRWRAS